MPLVLLQWDLPAPCHWGTEEGLSEVGRCHSLWEDQVPGLGRHLLFSHSCPKRALAPCPCQQRAALDLTAPLGSGKQMLR